MLKKTFRFFTKMLTGLLVLIIAYFLLAILLSLIPTNIKKPNCETNYRLYASTNGIHADLILPVKQLSTDLQQQLNIKASTTYVGFGWGDKKFYLETPTWNDLKFSTAMQAMFWKSETAMHITYYTRVSKNWKSLEICKSQSEDLNTFLMDSFEQKEDKSFVWTAEGYGRYDEFYEAKGSYSCLKTCNIWVNKALKKTGVKTPVWSPFDKGILRYFD